MQEQNVFFIIAKLIISDSESHWGQSAHEDSPFYWKVRNYSARCLQPDKHEYTWAGPQANLYLYWTGRLYGANGSLSLSGCSDACGGLEGLDLITQTKSCV